MPSNVYTSAKPPLRNVVNTYLDDLKKPMPQSNWRLEPRFPVSGAD